MTRRLPRRVTKHFNADILLRDLQQWRGTPEVGEEIAKAKQHSDELYRGFYKRPAADIHRVVMEIFEAGSDPKADPGSDVVGLAWAKLSEAMDAANASSQHIMVAYSPDDPEATKFLFHAEQVLYSLAEAELLLEGYL